MIAYKNLRRSSVFFLLKIFSFLTNFLDKAEEFKNEIQDQKNLHSYLKLLFFLKDINKFEQIKRLFTIRNYTIEKDDIFAIHPDDEKIQSEVIAREIPLNDATKSFFTYGFEQEKHVRSVFALAGATQLPRLFIIRTKTNTFCKNSVYLSLFI